MYCFMLAARPWRMRRGGCWRGRGRPAACGRCMRTSTGSRWTSPPRRCSAQACRAVKPPKSPVRSSTQGVLVEQGHLQTLNRALGVDTSLSCMLHACLEMQSRAVHPDQNNPLPVSAAPCHWPGRRHPHRVRVLLAARGQRLCGARVAAHAGQRGLLGGRAAPGRGDLRRHRPPRR